MIGRKVKTVSSITSDSASHANRLSYLKPNEDACMVDDLRQIYMLVDGVSRDRQNGIYPNPSPARQVSELFIKAVYRSLLNDSWSDPRSCLEAAASAGNAAIASHNQGSGWDFLPGTVGILALVIDQTLHFAYVGDCSLRIIRSDEAQLLTTSQTRLIHQRKSEFTASAIRNEIANNPQHPYAYGVFNGDRRALHFLTYGQQALLPGDVVILASDGLDLLLNRPDWRYAGESANELLLRAEALEAQQPSYRSDDKTVIILTLR
jgi:serine/threonine protein phosphatase PrpC